MCGPHGRPSHQPPRPYNYFIVGLKVVFVLKSSNITQVPCSFGTATTQTNTPRNQPHTACVCKQRFTSVSRLFGATQRGTSLIEHDIKLVPVPEERMRLIAKLATTERIAAVSYDNVLLLNKQTHNQSSQHRSERRQAPTGDDGDDLDARCILRQTYRHCKTVHSFDKQIVAANDIYSS